ncbi:hypothetical protein [Microbacterium terricola]|nr:hypothetical protein [Microbacterium terricola]UYK41002.1 hypothetical protein OAU46_04985 [Microbacterium terricola]
MGTLFYDGSHFALDDRLLAHLQIIISLKLRRNEGFFISWTTGVDNGSGRHAIWIDNGVAIRLQFDGTRPPAINREWAESLAMAANTNNGLVVTNERIEPAEDLLT